MDKRIITFNVCGIRNIFEFKPWNEKRSLESVFNSLNASIVCFQETKLQHHDLRKEWAIVKGYNSFFTFSSSKKGYSGVSVYVDENIPVLAAEEGITGWMPDLSKDAKIYRNFSPIGGYPEVAESLGRQIDSEGRTLVIDIGAAVLICLYCPCNSTGENDEYRQIFFELLDQRVQNLRANGREVIVLGDINVSPSLIDSAKAQQELKKNPEIVDLFASSPQRQIVQSWLAAGFKDTTRSHHPEREKMYTCWDLRVDGRGANFGSRIDLIIASEGLECTGSDILLDIYGSDHCPVYADFKFEIKEKPENYLVPLLSRKRTAAFAGLQSFWSKGAGASVEPRETKPVANLELEKEPDLKLPPNPTKSKPLKPAEAKITKGVKSFFTTKPKPELIQPKQPVPQPKLISTTSVSASNTTGATKNAWNEIFTFKKPLCYHKEEAKLLKSNKPGPNKGRSFWSCQRPQGEEGNKEFRCKFFKWA